MMGWRRAASAAPRDPVLHPWTGGRDEMLEPVSATWSGLPVITWWRSRFDVGLGGASGDVIHGAECTNLGADT